MGEVGGAVGPEGDGDDVEAVGACGRLFLGEVEAGGVDDAGALLGRDGLEGVAGLGARAGADLDEDAGAGVVGDDVQLAGLGAAAAPVAGDDAQAGGGQEIGGQRLGLAAQPGSAGQAIGQANSDSATPIRDSMCPTRST